MQKKIIYIVLSLLFVLQLNAQRSADNIFRQYKNDSGVMYLDMGGDFAKFLDEGQGVQSKIESVQIMVFSKGNNMTADDVKELKNTLTTSPYEMLIQAKHEGGKANLYVIDDGDYFTEIFGIIQSEEYNIYARIYGKLYYDDLAKLDMNMGGKANFGEIFGK
jgi:hypothetical protein